MTRHRILIDIEFDVDEARFKISQLTNSTTGVSDVTDAGVREAVTVRIIRADWTDQGLEPQRSTVTTRSATADGRFVEVVLPADVGVTPA